MYRRKVFIPRALFWLLPVAACSFFGRAAYAQVTGDTRGAYAAAFAALLSDRVEEAARGFAAAAERAPAGRTRWLGEELAALSGRCPAAAGDAAPLAAAFEALLDGEGLRAQSDFLGAAAAHAEGTGARCLGAALSEVARRYQELPPDGALAPPGQDPARQRRVARTELVVDGVYLGAFTGLSAALLLGIDPEAEDSPLPFFTLGAAAAGGALGYAYARLHPELTPAEVDPITAGMLLGGAQGLLLGGALGIPPRTLADGTKQLSAGQATLAWGGLAAGAASGAVAGALWHPAPGDSWLVASGGLWGSMLGLGTALVLDIDDGPKAAATVMTAYDAGILGGLLMARGLSLPAREVFRINKYSLLGFLGGLTLSLPVAIPVGLSNDGAVATQILATGALAGGLGGVILGFRRVSKLMPASAPASAPTAAGGFQGLTLGRIQGALPGEQPLTLNAAFRW
jgi:hypothetical protein